MLLSRDEVIHVAELAKLGLSDDEVLRFQQQLSAILDHIAILSELDTERVTPMAHVTGVESVMRDDRVTASLSADAVLGGAPDREGDCFKVPAVLEDQA